jgi:hypothetical protein
VQINVCVKLCLCEEIFVRLSQSALFLTLRNQSCLCKKAQLASASPQFATSLYPSATGIGNSMSSIVREEFSSFWNSYVEEVRVT